MDRIDFRLVAALRRDPLTSYAALGRHIERSASAARKRLDKLLQAGVVTGFFARPAPEVLGMTGMVAQWEATASTAALLDVPGTVMAGTMIGGGTIAGGYAKEPEKWIAAITDAVGEPPQRENAIMNYRGPIVGPLELRVMAAVVRKPRASAEALAAMCGLSAKTVRKKRATLVRSKALTITPILHAGRSDAIVYHVHVTCGPGLVGPVIRALGEVDATPDGSPVLCAIGRADTMEEQARRLAAVRELGVEKVEVIQEHEWVFRPEALVAMIEEALERWSPRGAEVEPRGPLS